MNLAVESKSSKSNNQFRFIKFISKIFLFILGFILLLALSASYLLFSPSTDSSIEHEKNVEKRTIDLRELVVSFSPKMHWEVLKGDVPIVFSAYKCTVGKSLCSNHLDFNDVSLRIKVVFSVIVLAFVKIIMLIQFLIFIIKEVNTIYFKGPKK